MIVKYFPLPELDERTLELLQYTVGELKVMLGRLNLVKTGNKIALVKRLIDIERDQADREFWDAQVSDNEEEFEIDFDFEDIDYNTSEESETSDSD